MQPVYGGPKLLNDIAGSKGFVFYPKYTAAHKLFSLSKLCAAPISSSHQMDSTPTTSPGSGTLTGAVVALGKFDALHIGHRALVEHAIKMGPPVLLSFSGMHEILGWEKRLPIVAPSDRPRVMSLWSSQCGGLTPTEFALEFSKVRHLTPRQFVEKLARELRVKGVVAGENYRFGYKAAGDSSELKRLCKECGLQVYIVEAVMDKFEQAPVLTGDAKDKGQVSSTRVRKALADGNMRRVNNLLGRNHRLILSVDKASTNTEQQQLKVPLSGSCNQYPAPGSYQCTVIFDGELSRLSPKGNEGLTEVVITENEAIIYGLSTEQPQGFLSIEF